MKKLATVALLMVALLVILVDSSEAGGRHRHFHGSRVFIGVGAYPYYYPYYPYYPHWYYPPPYYSYAPPTVIVREPPVYIEQPQQQSSVAPAPQAPSAPPEAYWYYCPSARGYYPSVPTCAETWVKVPPRQD